VQDVTLTACAVPCHQSECDTIRRVTDEWAEVFTEEFARPPSRVAARVWAEVFGDEYPAECEPYSFVTRTELAAFVDAVAGSDHLVDVGCGRGGPGLHVAARTGSRLTGVDVAPTALEAARRRAEALGLGERARFVEGGFEVLPLDDGAADAVMSIDAFLFAADKCAAARELHRVLRPGGTLVFTSWDYHRQPEERPPQVDDHRPVLEAAGFSVTSYEETPDWYALQRSVCAGLLANIDELAAEAGEDVDELRAGIEVMDRTADDITRRVLVVAHRGEGSRR
jgi:SAM-dependent methyltransferase